HANAPAPPSRCDSNTALNTPYASTPPLLTVLMLPWCPQDIPPMPLSTLLMPRPTRLMLSAAYHAYACHAYAPVVCSRRHSNYTPPFLPSPLPLTILTLPQRPQDISPTWASTVLEPPPTFLILSAAYHAYSRHAYAPTARSRIHSLCFHTPAAYNPYTPMAPSALLTPPPTRLMLSAAYHPYASILDP
ncbi:hypothetical protein O181_094434, partial [Austropuccinia psidii MF-1]|nr:hypothetical protein [Austropuccinia psidii MF-1]